MSPEDKGRAAPGEERANSDPTPEVVVRQATLADVPAIYAIQIAAYAALPAVNLCDERMLRLQIEAFPEGQLVAITDQKIAGSAFAMIIQLGVWRSISTMFARRFSAGSTCGAWWPEAASRAMPNTPEN
jgi:hypothetical protein